MKKLGLFAELSRRNVLRAAAIYIASVWALSQGIAQLAPVFNAPDWIARWFVIACAIGFPFWIAFSWLFEITPSGLKLESEVQPGESITRQTGRKLDFWIIGVMALAIVLLITNQFVLRRDATSVADANSAKAIAAVLAKVPEKSVAVLPFANESGDPKQGYFSDGLSEELITNLTQISDLKVIGKYSSFQFRDSKDSPAQIGATLGVANLIEGSVRQAGDELRITVNLIRAKDGSSVWSHAYDRPLKDVFAIQSEIGKAVADALKIKLVGATLVDQQKPPSGNVEAYQLMLQGRAQARRATKTDMEQGIALMEQAVKLDPNYAYVWAMLANTGINLGDYYLGGEAREQAFIKARTALDRASMLAPDASFVHRTRGNLLSTVDKDPAGGLKEMQRALALAPNDSIAMSFLAVTLSDMGQPQKAAELLRKAIATDPLRADWYAHLSTTLVQLGQFDEAEQSARKAIALQPQNPGHYLDLSNVLAARGNFDAAEQAARKAVALQPDDPANLLQLATILDDRGQTDEAIRTARKALALQPDYPGVHMALARYALRRGDPATALREAEKESYPDSKAYALALAKQAGDDRAAANAALEAYIEQHGKPPVDYVGIAEMYALRKQPDPMFEWLQRGVAHHDLATIGTLLTDPLLLPYHDDPRFVALLEKVGLPMPGKPAPASKSTAAAAQKSRP